MVRPGEELGELDHDRLLRALHEVAVATAGILDPAELARIVSGHARDLTGADGAALYVWDDAMRELACLHLGDARDAHSGGPIQAGHGAAGQAFMRRQPVTINDYPHWKDAIPAYVAAGLRSIVAVPLQVAERPIGALVARSYRAHAMRDEHVDALSLLAAQVAPVFEAARLFGSSERRRQEAEALREITQSLASQLDEPRTLEIAVRAASRLLEAPYTRVWLLEADGRLVHAAGHGFEDAPLNPEELAPDSVTAQVLQTGSLALADALAHPSLRAHPFVQSSGLRAYLAVPLRRAGEPIGVLTAMRGLGRSFAASEQELLEALGDAVALAVHNARLYRNAQQEIVERRRAEQAIRESERLYRQLFQDNQAIKLLIDPRTAAILDVNDAACAFYGYSREQMLGLKASDLNTLTPDEVMDEMARAVREERNQSSFRHRLASGALRDVEVYASPLDVGGQRLLLEIIHDVSDRRRAESRLEHQAWHDLLTGLPNRARLHATADALIGDGSDQTPFALLLLDVDRFKEINDTLGHHRGDLLLQALGERLGQVLGPADLLARLGGDEFAVLLPGADAAQAATATQRLLRNLEAPFVLEGAEVEIDASLGIALYPTHAKDGQTLLRHADVALYIAKAARTEFAFYTPEQDAHSPERLAMLAELRRAIDRDELVLHYQPQVDLRSGALVAAEALVRWQHPERGILPPGEFVPLAEQTRLIRPLSRWVLKAALRQAAAWRREGRDLIVTLNLSVYDLQDTGLLQLIREQLDAHGVPPDHVCLEITESALLSDPRRASALLGQLRALGLRIAIDDFGTGYSSLTYLKDLPVDELKIDRSFVQGMATDAGARAIVRAVVDLAADLELRVIAEGVEDQSTWEILAALGCDLAQGYYFLPPVPPAQLPTWQTGATPWLLDAAVRTRAQMALDERSRERGGRLAAEEAFLARKRAEAALAESEERLRLVMAAARMGTIDYDIVAGTVTISAETAMLFELPPETRIWNPRELVGLVHPDDLPQLRDCVFNASSDVFETQFRLRLGRGQIRWLGVSGRVFRAANGRLTRVVGAALDITERMEADRQRERMAQAEKLRALGQMASGIAHDLNQSLGLIAGYGELAQRALAQDPPDVTTLREAHAIIAQAADEGGRAVGGLLTFARSRPEGEPEAVDAVELLQEVASLSAPRWRDAAQEAGRPIDMRVETDAASGPLQIHGWRTALRDALMNLVFNAIDALPEGGTIGLRAHAAPDGCVVVEVADSGVGMPPEVQARVFEPFFSTRGERGTGLGLSQVFGIVERHSGRIELQSAPGHGTTFRLSLPAAPSAESATGSDAPAAGPARRLRILAVDDEPLMGNMLQRILRPHKHTVVVAHSGEEALGHLAAERFDVLVSAIGMGAGMNGWELVEQARRKWPDLRIVLATGWAAALDPAEVRARGVDVVVAKPFRPADIERALLVA